MTLFWLAAAAITLIGLGFIILPLMRQKESAQVSRMQVNKALYESKLEELQADLEQGLLDPSEYQQSEQELQRSLLSDVKVSERSSVTQKRSNLGMVVLLTIALPLSAILLYQQFTTYIANDEYNEQQKLAQQAQTIQQSIEALEQRLQDKPDDLEGWKILGQSYVVMQQFDKAVGAYSQAAALSDYSDPDLLVLLAETSSFANDGVFGTIENALLEQALAVNPKHERALWYAGYAAYSEDDYQAAVAYWQTLLSLVPADRNDVRDSLNKFVADAREKAGLEAAPAEQAALARVLYVQVTVAQELAKNYQDSDTVFIYARAKNGPKMPLSLVRVPLSALPIKVELTEATSMLPNMNLRSFEQVEVLARISPSGQAISQAGDLISAAVSVDFSQDSEHELEVSIQRVVE
ncbi:c-type cytochrome biogenesis protein CcmI [Gammaproteobacteria bacterium]|mgnify:FL=1|nr:c-type cytochrome biogenesis protein CcmI [Pseudomonadota bacterium]MDC1284924.1 c-type cytochrome biogenesis protein CcmI [Gammaproteobacteria bacterium]